jgi:signal transduction histidine kinase
VLFALALVFSSAAGASRVAENARALHWSNATAGSTAIARLAVAQAVVFGIDYELGAADATARDQAIAEATGALDEVERWLGDMDPDVLIGGDTVATGVAAFVATGRATLVRLEEGATAEADRSFHALLEPAYAETAVLLHAEQDAIAQRISDTEDMAGFVGSATSFLITLLIPALALIVYFMLARRQFRDAQVRMDAKLTAERELNRSKDEFIAGISHELRTPLTSIYGFSEHLVENGIIDPTEALELITLINHDSAELSRMVEDLLTAARLDSDALNFHYEAVPMLGEIDSVITPMRRAGATVSTDGDDEVVWADRARVRQIIRNLVSNAIRHGGDTVKVVIDQRSRVMALTVTDNGDGVTADVEARLFDRFVHDGRAPLLTGSVGLGLSIARSLAKTMGGDITYVRALGWTNFVLTLPLATAAQIAESPRPMPAKEIPEPPILSITLPQADDEEAVHRSIATIHAMSFAIEDRDDDNEPRYTVEF